MMNFAYTIAGSEATGGAGFQVDLKTFQQLGVYGTGALTCIVSFDPDNDWNHKFVPIPADIIRDQMRAALATHDIRTTKVAMLGHPATIDAVEEGLRSQEWDNIVVDPVLICKGQEPGQALDTDNALREKILPLATVTTPNNFEARTLSGLDSLETVDDLVEAAKRISDLGPKYVVVKGGIDFPGEDAVDVLWDGSNAEVYSVPKIGEERVSGAGCTLAAAITAELAKGSEIRNAVQVAKDMVTAGIRSRVEANTPFTTVWQGAYSQQL
ncbi:bifunctional hydroxymethylpyrimidine kinase/phosphomethylpyrimidine kinase [Actinobaculum suis]|nr:bifunctional hydroxymethylpyrimidine kinase/phosphomethylpyrimidine kinase [Actinobaculum suis]OCA95624.1 bifunctional hydroxymethylpyrimidine kinase/phosphomethylpyrimidine kinase [Actinobaculum suis]